MMTETRGSEKEIEDDADIFDDHHTRNEDMLEVVKTTPVDLVILDMGYLNQMTMASPGNTWDWKKRITSGE